MKKQAERKTLLVKKGKANKKVDGLKTEVEMARVSLCNAAIDQISANNEHQVSDIHFLEFTKTISHSHKLFVDWHGIA